METVKPRIARANHDRVFLRRQTISSAALAAITLASLACTAYAPASDTLEETVDGMLNAGNTPLAGDWSCLSNVVSGPNMVPMSTVNAPAATYVLPLIDFVTGMPPA